MKLAYFSNAFVGKLRETAAANAANYESGSAWLDSLAASGSYVHESNQVVDPPPQLLIAGDDTAAHDAANAQRVFEWLSKLTPAIAMEERLWAYLTHVVFAEYMRARWPVTGASAIHRRYLFEGKSFASLSRNGIARLWWAAFLTRDEEREAPYELTGTLFLRQDIQVSLLERSLGKCRRVRFAVLEFLKANADWLATESFGRRIQLLLKEMNLLGGVAILDAVPPAELQAFLQRVGEKLVRDENSQELGAGET